MSLKQRLNLKRILDICLALPGLLLLLPLLLLLLLLSSMDTRQWGFFTQDRVGQHGRLFKIFKLRTMRGEEKQHITVAGDSRITPLGKHLRQLKLDELPQLLNIIKGDMSFVGPRPDVPGYADLLSGEDAIILELKPGITGPATLKFRNEEELLAQQADPVQYNDQVIWPEKIKINRRYAQEFTPAIDLQYILKTIF